MLEYRQIAFVGAGAMGGAMISGVLSCNIVEPSQKKYAEVTFLDFPPSDERKAALDKRSLTQMREVDALTQVVRAFDDPIAESDTDPLRDLRGFQSELILADMEIIENGWVE